MPTIKDLISRPGVGDEVGGVISGPWYGVVIAPAPTAVLGKLWVDIPDISYLGQVKWQCYWSRNLLPSGTMPVVGSPVLVIFDNRQQPWVVGIWQ